MTQGAAKPAEPRLWLRVCQLLAVAAMVWVAAQGIHGYQEDFRLFLSAGAGAAKGIDPYDVDALFASVRSRESHNLNWFYPPHALALVSALSKLPMEQALALWQGAKLLALLGLLALWWRWYGRRVGWVVFAGIALFSYRRPLVDDLSAGNWATWEQLFLWLGVWLYCERRAGISGLFFFLSAQWKLTLSALAAAIALFAESSGRLLRRTATFFAAAVAGAVGWALAAYPGLLSSFWANLMSHTRSDTGDIGWDGTHFSSLYNFNYLFQDARLGRDAWLVLVALIAVAALRQAVRWRRRESGGNLEDRALFVAFLCASYGLCVPRLKLYSLTVFIPGLLECLARARPWRRRPDPGRVLLMLAVVAVTFGGTSMENHDLPHRIYNLRFLAANLLLWAMLYRWISRETSPG